MGFFSAIKSLLGMKSEPKTLGPGDRLLNCEDCHQEFIFDAGEQRFFKEKGFTDPKRCPKCRRRVRSRMRRRRGRGGGGGGGGGGGERSNQEQRRDENRGRSGRRGRFFGRRNSVIDGDSPYADER